MFGQNFYFDIGKRENIEAFFGSNRRLTKGG
jgi:hypothetical protein